jgi:hypothetical protein
VKSVGAWGGAQGEEAAVGGGEAGVDQHTLHLAVLLENRASRGRRGKGGTGGVRVVVFTDGKRRGVHTPVHVCIFLYVTKARALMDCCMTYHDVDDVDIIHNTTYV